VQFAVVAFLLLPLAAVVADIGCTFNFYATITDTSQEGAR